MLKKIFVISLLSTIYFLQSFLPAQAQESWTIPEFNSELILNKDTSLTVTETIIADFGTLEKHGIYRNIPVRYQTPTGNTLDVRFHLLSVTNSQDREYQYDLTKEGDYVNIKIGDPDSTITGINTYKITYSLKRVLTKPTDEAELAWNVTGHDWPVPILKSSATVRAPEGSINRTICFTGYFGSKAQNCTHGHDGSTAEFTATVIEPDSGFTLALAVKPRAFTFPGTLDEVVWFLTDNWPYSLPVLTLIIMIHLYLRRGRDQVYKDMFSRSGQSVSAPLFAPTNTHLVYSPPKDLTPGEIGTLIDERAGKSDITATIIDLARRGFITIKESKPKGLIFKKPEFTLIYHDQPGKPLASYESSVLDLLFTKSRHNEVILSKLPLNSYMHLESAQKNLYTSLTDSGYFIGNPSTVRNTYLGVGIAISVLGIFFVAPILSGVTSSASSYIGLGLSGVIIALFSPFMPARTAKGSLALREALGLKEWISIGAWREKIHEKNNFFEEVLPFAIAFGLTEKFINAFKDAHIKKPTWYQGSGTFNPVYFNNSISSFDNALTSSVAASRPQSSSGSSFGGGGSSGGGFGGGGGGSW